SLIAAVLTREGGDDIARKGDQTAGPTAQLLDEAVRSRLLLDEPGTGRRRFAHALVREVLVAELSLVESGRLHRAVAEYLERDGQAAERLAFHWANAAGEDAPARAGAWSQAAAASALASLGFEQAVGHLRRALSLPGADRVTVLLRLGEAQRLAG